MSEIQIILPLSAIQGAESMSPAELTEFLSNATNLREEVAQIKEEYNQLVQGINSSGRNLERILDEVEGLEKYRALRTFANEMKQMQVMPR